MKIIDFEKKGNQVKFYLGSDDCDNYYGDDWDDRPYEHNAGLVYDKFILGWFVKTFHFDDIVMEPSIGYSNSNWCKNDMKDKKVPCICVLPKQFKDENNWYYEFNDICNNENVIKYYMGDKVDEDKEDIYYIKNNNTEDKYFTINIGKKEDFKSISAIEEKNIKISVIQLSTLLKYMANNIYLDEIDENTYDKLENFVNKKLKKYFIKLLKENAKQLDIELSDIILKNITINNEYLKDKIGFITYKICYSSKDNFKIGKVDIKYNT